MTDQNGAPSTAMINIGEIEIARNSAWAAEVQAGQVLRVTARSGVSLVAFNRKDPSERFDQARTKVYNMKLWLEPGDKLFSKLNNPMLTVVSDGFAPIGRHDLQLGMCAGCLDSLAAALAPWRISADVIPMPLNAFQHAAVDVVSGAIAPTSVRPSSPMCLELKADIDLIVAAAACPDPLCADATSPVGIVICEPA